MITIANTSGMKVLNKYLAFSLLILGFLAACGDDTFDAFPPYAPLLANPLSSDSATIELTDSIKNALKGEFLGKSYSFTVTVSENEESTAIYLRYTLSGGTGVLKRNNLIVTDTIASFTPNQPMLFTFTPNETNTHYKLQFSGFNKYGLNSIPATLTLVVFENSLPVANFTVKQDEKKPYNYLFDASTSYDSDSTYGGSIKLYEYQISRNGTPFPLVRSYDSITSILLPDNGVYTSTLRVYDNDGGLSEPISVDFRVEN